MLHRYPNLFVGGWPIYRSTLGMTVIEHMTALNHRRVVLVLDLGRVERFGEVCIRFLGRLTAKTVPRTKLC